jgi:hypothetical protein
MPGQAEQCEQLRHPFDVAESTSFNVTASHGGRQRFTGRGDPRELTLQRVDLCEVATDVVVAAALAACEPENGGTHRAVPDTRRHVIDGDEQPGASRALRSLELVSQVATAALTQFLGWR